MTHKQDAPFATFLLPQWQVIEAIGSDAGAFLQAQLMNDVRAIAAGQWQWNGWLTPKGRLIALFALIAIDAQRYWLVVPDFPAAELIARMQRFVFRSKLKLSVRENCWVSGAFTPSLHAHASAISHDTTTDTVELDFSGDGGARTLRISPKPDEAADAIDAANVSQWNAFDLAHGLPHLPIDQSESWTPQMISLDRLNAYSLKKGCYPGQEIVARTHYLGQAKRGLVRIVGNDLAVGAEVVAGEKKLGTIINSLGDEGLAVLRADRPTDGWECAGSLCHELPLLGGLGR